MGHTILDALWRRSRFGLRIAGRGVASPKDRRRLARLGLSKAAWLVPGVAVALIAVLAFALTTHLRVLDRWRDEPRFLVLPLLGSMAMIGLWLGTRRRRDGMPFAMASLVVTCAFLMLGVSFWPYMIPYSVTVQQAAAPTQSLEFLFWVRESSCFRSC